MEIFERKVSNRVDLLFFISHSLEGDLDFRGTLGVDKTAPVGFVAIRLFFDIKLEEGAEVEESKLQKLGQLTERYCVVLQTIAKKPELSLKVTRA